MSIIYKKGNIFDSEAEGLVNPVNCLGVMGKGQALSFKRLFPENFKSYVEACQKGVVFPGNVLVVKEGDRFIFNFPTKEHWKNPSQLKWISIGLEDLAYKVRAMELSSIAIPALGCGNGGLNWFEVKKEIEWYLSDLDCRVEVFYPE